MSADHPEDEWDHEDSQALDAIAELLSKPRWNVSDLETIARIVKNTGREIR